jgi:peptidyl-prolyl cis-trans isomerase B (cyclophilin B)
MAYSPNQGSNYLLTITKLIPHTMTLILQKTSAAFLALISISFILSVNLALAQTADQTNNNEQNIMIIIQTNHGTIEAELYSEDAPVTVDNFLKYIREGFYDGTIFHRIIPGFMIQGGGFEPGLVSKDNGAPIPNEANNGLLNELGTFAMARTGDPHSATSQFFINASDNSFLNHTGENPSGWGYAVFGKVTTGMDVVALIEQVATGQSGGHGDVPVEDVLIESITVSEN